MLTIGVAIPCYKPHYHFLNRMIASIVGQTHKPDQVVVSCSSWDYDGAQNFTTGGVSVTIVYAQRRILQAENRNVAASLLDTDIISFIDADDLMLPRRLEYVVRMFEETKCDGVVHDYQYVKHGSNTPFEKEGEYMPSRDPIVKDPVHVGCNAAGEHTIHHAHVSITRDVFSRFQYPTEEQFYRIEDSVYVATLVQSGMVIRHLRNKLSQYFY